MPPAALQTAFPQPIEVWGLPLTPFTFGQTLEAVDQLIEAHHVSPVYDYRERRASMLAVLNALTISGDRVHLLRSAEELAAARDRGDYEETLDVLESLIRDAWALVLGRPEETIVNSDLINDLKKIAAEFKSEQAAAWPSEIEELRAALIVNINRRVASDALLLSMAYA